MAPTEGWVTKPERPWGWRRGTPDLRLEDMDKDMRVKNWDKNECNKFGVKPDSDQRQNTFL